MGSSRGEKNNIQEQGWVTKKRSGLTGKTLNTTVTQHLTLKLLLNTLNSYKTNTNRIPTSVPAVQRQGWSSVVWTYSWFLSGSCWGKGDATPYDRFPSGSSILCDHLPRGCKDCQTLSHWMPSQVWSRLFRVSHSLEVGQGGGHLSRAIESC